VFSVSIRGDEKQVAVAGFDGMVRLFNSDTGVLESSFPAAAVSTPPAATAAVGK
jgi:hypothetical protein